MNKYLYNIEKQKTKNDLEISIFKKGYQSPLYSIIYKNVNKCDFYMFVKNKEIKGKNQNYEVILCRYCRGDNESLSLIKKISKRKQKIIRKIKNSKNLRNGFKNTIKLIPSMFQKFKYKKIGNLKIYSTNDNKIINVFVKSFNDLHKIR